MRGFDSNLTLQKLEVLCVVAELQSITRAADQLCISQPVVTAHIRSLEEKLGAALIRREGRGIALTESGSRVLKWAQGVLTRTRELQRELAGAEATGPGRAVVAASMSAGSYLLPPLVCDFYLQNPEGRVQIVVSTPLAALESVRSGAADFAVITISPNQNLEGVAAEPLWNETLLLVSAPQSKWVGESVERDAISRLPFISTYSLVAQQLEEGQLRANGIASRHIVLELGHPEAQKEAVRRDLGVCFFRPSAVANDFSRGDLRRVHTPGLEMSIPLYIVCRNDKELSPFQLALKTHIMSALPLGVSAFEGTRDTPVD
ncbi:LysR family transcriptional regulator [Ramlibacter sp. WS9]|nr:LysR family transcriptional regulator [Ramlibacter sp. WS9]